MKINGNKPKEKIYDERKKTKKKNWKRLQVAPPGFEPAPQLPPAQIVRHRTTEPCDHYKNKMSSLIALKYSFSAIHTVWTLWRGIYHESKIWLRKNSLNKYSKAISHYLRVYPLSSFIKRESGEKGRELFPQSPSLFDSSLSPTPFDTCYAG